MLFKEIITVHSKNHTEHMNTKYNVKIVKTAGAYNYH
jgi:hypothetical protein